MATQESPVRINSTLLAQVQAAAETFNRKLPDQLAYWASLGRLVESKLSGNELSALFSGIGDIKVVVGRASDTASDASKAAPLSIVDLAMSNQTPQAFKQTSEFIAAKSPGIRYEGIQGYPGLLRRISPDGSMEVGTFKNGKFRKSAKANIDWQA